MLKLYGYFLVVIYMIVSVGGASAYEVGDMAYICKKNQKFMWVIGEDSWSACAVRIIQSAGGSYKVLANQGSCMLPGFGQGVINRGTEEWVEGYALWPSRSACENQGRSSRAASLPPPPEVIPHAANAMSYDILTRLDEEINLAESENIFTEIASAFIIFAIDNIRQDPDRLLVKNSCGEDIRLTLEEFAGSNDIKSWTISPIEGISFSRITVSDGENYAPASNNLLMFARTANGSRMVWAGSDDKRNLSSGTVYFRRIEFAARPRFVEFCPE